MSIERRKTKTVKIGNISIGGRSPVVIQSMTKTKTQDSEATLQQIRQLERLGVEIVRLAVKDKADAAAIGKFKGRVGVPLVADIHFDWRLAIAAIENGADKIRLNPGNIYKEKEVKEVVRAAKSAHIPIRIGLNSGSLERIRSRSLKSQGIPDLMVEAATNYIKILEGLGFYDIVISLKASDISDTIAAYRKMAGVCAYPLHLGVTATGLPLEGAIKSSMAIGILLLEGIGDTIRVSLTDRPGQEVKVGQAILKALGLRSNGYEIISCPTCGRCEVDLVKIVRELEKKISAARHRLATHPLKLAVMGCVVNGPGEARHADIGVAFGRGSGLLFKKGKPVRKISSCGCVDILLEEMANLTSS